MKKENLILLQEVIGFIEKFNPVFEDIAMDEYTTIEEDLRITGEDANDLFIEYAKYFKVDISKFMISDFFQEECSFYAGPKLSQKKDAQTLKPFTVGDLVKGVKAGKLDESVLSNP